MGVFAVDRAIFDHPMFAPEPYTEREAWIWMCGAAAYKPTRVRCGRSVVVLERGQLSFSNRFLAAKWKWSESRVRRFLKRIESDAAVTLKTTRETTQITICNYDKHQFGQRTIDAAPVLQIDAPPTHRRRKEEELKNLRREEEDLRIGADAPKYVFDGSVVKLNAKTFGEWKAAFPHLDLLAELTARDAWLQEASAEDQKKWFISTSQHLANRNMRAKQGAQVIQLNDPYRGAL